MLPALARAAIETYSNPGELVLDPRCGTGTTLVEAIYAGRHAAGITPSSAWARLAHAGVRHARHLGAPGRAAVIQGDARQTTRLLALHAEHLLRRQSPTDTAEARLLPFRRVDLILTTAPRHSGELDRLASASAELLRPGGFVVLVGAGPAAVTACAQSGLTYWQHVVALTVPVRDGKLCAPSISARRRRAAGPIACHQDVLAFRQPDTAEQALATTPVEGVKAVAL
jgi:SAM-dependent methyltransferase